MYTSKYIHNTGSTELKIRHYVGCFKLISLLLLNVHKCFARLESILHVIVSPRICCGAPGVTHLQHNLQYRRRATLWYEWAGSNGHIPQPNGKQVRHSAGSVFHRVIENTGGPYPKTSARPIPQPPMASNEHGRYVC